MVFCLDSKRPGNRTWVDNYLLFFFVCKQDNARIHLMDFNRMWLEDGEMEKPWCKGSVRSWQTKFQLIFIIHLTELFVNTLGCPFTLYCSFEIMFCSPKKKLSTFRCDLPRLVKNIQSLNARRSITCCSYDQAGAEWEGQDASWEFTETKTMS